MAMSYTQLPQNDQASFDSDVENDVHDANCTSEDDAESSWPSLRRGRLIAGGALLVTAVVAVLAIRQTAFRGLLADEDPVPQHSARALLESPSMAAVTTRNLLKVRPELARNNDKLRNSVSRSLKNLTKYIQLHEPKVYEQLNALKLSTEQEDSVLSAVQRLSDSRLQSLGSEIGHIAHETRSLGAESLKTKLTQKFEADRHGLRQLRNDVLPRSLHAPIDKDLDLSFNPENMRLVRHFPESGQTDHDAIRFSRQLEDISRSGHTGAMLDPKDYDTYSSEFEEGLGIICGLLEQVRVALDQIDFVGESFDVDMKIPYWAKSAVGGLDFVSELTDCVMRGETNEVKLMMCPMKYASAAADFLESIDNILGINNGHFFSSDTTLPPGVTDANYRQQPQAVNGAHGYDQWQG